MKLAFTRRAESDLIAIDTYGFLTFGQSQAVRYRSSLNALFDLMILDPSMGVRVLGTDAAVRMAVHRPHVILYRFDASRLTILRVLDGRSEWRRFLPAQST